MFTEVSIHAYGVQHKLEAKSMLLQFKYVLLKNTDSILYSHSY